MRGRMLVDLILEPVNEGSDHPARRGPNRKRSREQYGLTNFGERLIC